MSSTEVVVPDGVFAPDETVEAKPWDEPCPVCQNQWNAGPERAGWGRQHCWKCGYAPGQNAVAVFASGGAPEQPDWAKLVNDAVRQAMTSQPQVLAEAMTAALGREGMANLAAEQQARLGMSTDPKA